VGGPDRVSLKAGDGMRNPQEDRRTFLSQLLTGSLLVSLIGVLGTVIAYLFPPERRVFNPARRRMRVARADEIPLGKGKQVLFDGEPVWVLHLKGGWSAFSAICTHQGCIVHWDEKRRTLTLSRVMRGSLMPTAMSCPARRPAP
jgi:cytochrome b6-f complex iron-sulfur subunit